MAFVTGMMILDAPASALNNSGLDKSASTANRVLVKKIRTADGWYPYVSAQAFRYWLRSAVAESALGFEMSPVHLGEDIAFSDSNPIVYWDDDLFGYMRAPKSSDKTGIEFGTGLEKKAGKSKKKRICVNYTYLTISCQYICVHRPCCYHG